MIKKVFLVVAVCFYSTVNSLSIYTTNLWQVRDNDGTAMPYFTDTFLKELSKWDVKNWSVFIWSAGDCPAENTLSWFARRCKKVTYVDWNQGWINQLNNFITGLRLNNVNFMCRDIERKVIKNKLFGKLNVNTLSDYGEDSAYVNAISENDQKYDCIVVDGHHRNTCVKYALPYLKSGGIIVLNNASQGTLGINSQKAFRTMKQYSRNSFKHSKHIDWCTDYWKVD